MEEEEIKAAWMQFKSTGEKLKEAMNARNQYIYRVLQEMVDLY